MIRDLKKSLKAVDTKQLSWDLVEMITLDLNKEKEQYADVRYIRATIHGIMCH